ncbi:MAG: NRDE family protein [Desulforegulaceae bacterium]|nr:NRDE family protein [Desulforegulaceae bacterium]
MCLIVFSYRQNKDYPLIIAANRDEFYKRKTKTLDLIEENPLVISGKDLESGGTWMGINRKTKKFAAVTNYRDPSKIMDDAKSRGIIVSSFLKKDEEPLSFLERLKKEKDIYNGFNFILGSTESLYHYSNINDQITQITPGLHAVCNHLLNTPWPKVIRAKKISQKSFESEDIVESSLEMLKDDKLYKDSELPETGMGIEFERLLSPIFVKSETYGTRSSSVILVDKNQNIRFKERAFLEKGLLKDTEFFIS